MQNCDIILDYTNDDSLIEKNTSLIVSRVPLNVEQNRSWDRCQSQAITGAKDDLNSGLTVDSMRSDGLEDDKIRAIMNQSTQDNNPSKYYIFLSLQIILMTYFIQLFLFGN